MFSLEETLTWTSDEVHERLRSVLPAGWSLERTTEAGWHRVTLLDPAGIQQWTGEHPDPKFVGLDALGWLRLRNHQVKHPAWKPRETEVPLYRDPVLVSAPVPDPPDLDPSEVEAVYRTTR
jgi:hypothetical protein